LAILAETAARVQAWVEAEGRIGKISLRDVGEGVKRAGRRELAKEFVGLLNRLFHWD
jgi:hypothetical protein